MQRPWNPYPIRGPYFPVTAYGAVGDNATLCTAAFRAAFADCVASGGGYVEVPAGAYRTGKIMLRSRCYLLLRSRGIVQGSTDQREYGSDWDYWSTVVGRNVSNTGVVGPAARDAASGGELRGVMWQMVKGYDAATNTLEAMQWLPCGGGPCRPGNLALHDATNVTIAGVSLTESSGWCQLFRRCSNVLEVGVRVEGSVQWGTADGMDVESGTNLTFRDSSFRTGDDCLAFRSGTFGKLRTPWPPGPIAPVQHVRLLNLSLVSSSSAIKLEANTQTDRLDVGEIRDVFGDDIRIEDTNRGIGIWQRTGHGAIRDVVMRNLEINTRFDSKPEFWGSGEPIFVSALPAPGRSTTAAALVRNITFEDVVATSENGALLSSLPLGARPAVADVRLLNVTVAIRKTGNVSRPQRDYRPARAPFPETWPASVVGITFENVAGAVVAGGGVSFDAPLQPSWSLRCVNTSTATGVRFERGWECHNETGLR